jgi:proline iminopeptidase
MGTKTRKQNKQNKQNKQSIPYTTGYLPLPHGYTLYVEEHGSPEGTPVLCLHGGPGGSLTRTYTGLFDLRKTRVILYDQRGCGKSTPVGVEGLKQNTTWDLVRDIEVLREHLGIPAWYVVGGSWGTTLALAYAETHPTKVTGLLLRGVCLLTDTELDWLEERGGTSEIFPEEWKAFLEPLPASLRRPGVSGTRILNEYYRLIRSKNRETRKKAIRAWYNWESAVSFLKPIPDSGTDKEMEELALLETHYFRKRGWLKPNQLLRNAYKLKGIPVDIVHGRYDLVCPFRSAYELHQAIPHSKLYAIPDAGHGMMEPGTFARMKNIVRERGY